MMFRLRPWAVLALLAGCAVPPPSAYVSGSTKQAGAQVAIGKNTVGEACTQQADGGAGAGGTGADIFCGTWLQPSAQVRNAGPATQAGLTALATASPWRTGLDTRFACGAPAPSTILGGQAALIMQCTRRIGGWPQVAMVALAGGRAWLADGVLPVLPVMERSIGVLSGLRSADAAPVSSAADALMADRLAARSFGSGDIGLYDQLIEAGTRANLADDPVHAEAAFRQALAVQEKALGKNNPNAATPLSYLALQLSDQGRFSEAADVFARARPLVARAADPIAGARLLHYEALNAFNQGDYKQALALLAQAETAYSRDVPPEALRARASTARITRVGTGSLADLLPNQQLLTDPSARAALFGIVDVRRYRSMALRHLGDIGPSIVALQSAVDLARGNDLLQPEVSARLFRTSAMSAASQGRAVQAADDLAESSQDFGRAMPDSKPLANTILLRAAEIAHGGDNKTALALCRRGISYLSALKVGTSPDLISGCLDIYATEASAEPAERQGIIAEMFAASQVGQGGITSQQIAQATARLSENARDPKVAGAIRARQDASSNLTALYRQKDSLIQSAAGKQIDTSVIDKKIAAAQANLADTDAALQAASPNYGQLVQQVVSARTVQTALRPTEAFVSMTLSDTGGWLFLVRPTMLAISRIPGGEPRMAAYVKKIRASIESNEDSPPPFDIADARALYGDTLGGVASDMTGVTSLTVAPAGPLLSLPFEVLLTGPASNDTLGEAPWLVRKYVIAHVPSPSNFVSLRKIASGSRGTRPWFGFGEFQPITLVQAQHTFPGAECAESAQLLSTLPALPYAGRELQVAQLLLGGQSGDELVGPAFTAAAVLKAHLKDYRILQFSTHALLPSELKCQSEPAIVTSAPAGASDAGGALLTSSEVATMDLDADLVILSACNSGGPGGTTAGESLSGLARSFFYAGARALLVTHWAVNDQTAAFLVADTLRRFRQTPNLGIAAALRAAQLGMLNAAGHGMVAAVAHPFYWAPFALIGDGGEHAPLSTERATATQIAGR